MVFSELVEFVSSATRFSEPKTSNFPYKLGLPPVSGSLHGYTISSPKTEQMNLRFSSSLQDLSIYQPIDPEGDHRPGSERSSSHVLPQKLLQQENGVSSFSKEKISLGPSGRKKWDQVICAFLCFLLLTFLCFALLFLYSNWSGGQSKFYVVLDCGSTGTRVYVFEASVNHNKDGNLPISLKSLPESLKRKSGSSYGRAYNRMETEPGIDKLVNNVSGLRKAVKPLIRWAEKQIPDRYHRNTSLFLYATAGVRRLPSSDSKWLLNSAWSILKSSPFLCKREWVKTITGMEEAYYGWIALNYHTEVLGAVPKKETYGSLDLGGSSLQVTFEGKPDDHEEASLKLSIGPVNHHLSAYSLTGYGLNDAFDKSVVHLLMRLPKISNADLVKGKVEIKHPCLQSGYKERYLCSQCASATIKSGTPPVERKESGEAAKVGVPVQLIGNSKWEDCSALAKAAVNFSEWSDHNPGINCDWHPCALAENLPRPVGQFYAMSGFYVVYRFFNLTPDAELDDVLEKGREFCEKTWDVARKSVVRQPFIEQYCFRAPYVVLLLREGLHIIDKQVTIGSGSITWTLGVALYEAGKAFPNARKLYSYHALRAKIDPHVVFAILCASFFVLVCALSCIGHLRIAKLFRRSHLPLFSHNSGTSISVLNVPAPFRFQRWSPMNTGDERVKMPLSPTLSSSQQRPFDTGLGFSGGGIQFTDSPLYSSSSSVAHSNSSGSVGNMQFDYNVSSWAPNRSQMRLQSRRSQSREDLNNSISDAHLVKV